MRSYVAILALAALAASCKKKPPVEAPAEVPVEAPQPGRPAPADTDGSASADPEPTPAPAPAPKPAPDPVDDKERLRQDVNNAVKLLETSDVAQNRQALTTLEGLQKAHPDAAILDLNIGVAQQKLGNPTAAQAAWEAALRKDPSLGHSYLYLGQVKEQAGDLKGAEAMYRQGIQKDPDNVDVRVGLVSTLRKQKRLDDAIAEAQHALKLNTMSTEIYNDVGLAYMERGDLLLAKFMFQKALGIPGGEEKAYLQANLGWAYYKEQKIPQATFRLKKAVELDPEYVPGLVYLARVYMEDRNYTETVDLLERAARQAPDNHGVQMNLGVAYRGVGRFDDAKKAYERALAIQPSNPDPHFNLGVLQGDYYKNYDEAVAAFGRYKAGGGKDAKLADQYIADVQKEKELVERRKKQMEAAAKREADRKERERLAAEEEARLKAQQPPPAPETPAPAPETPAPAPETPAPAPEQGGTP